MGASSQESRSAIKEESFSRANSWLRFLAPAVAFIGVAVALQVAGGAYHAEFARDPDEPGHVVSGIAVARYMQTALFRPPLPFFRDYYEHYPKVALGNWPPALYVAEGIAIIVVKHQRYALLLLQALCAGLVAWLVFRQTCRLVGNAAAALGGTCLLCTTTMQVNGSMVMAEVPLVLAMFAACLAFARYAETGRARDAFLFAVLMSAAVLTKGTGWALAAIPLAVAAATRNWRMLLRRNLWLAGVIVAALCVPWYYFTLRIASHSFGGKIGLAYTKVAVVEFTREFFTLPGAAIAVAGVAGIIVTVLLGHKLGRTRAYWASLAGLIAGVWLMLVTVPAAINNRYLLSVVPPIFVMAAAAARQLGNWRAPGPRHALRAGVIFGGLALATLVLSLPPRSKQPHGFIPVASTLDMVIGNERTALIVSDAIGEGALISEFAMREPEAKVYLLRGSKLLASQGWNGENYRARVHSGDECWRLLESVPVAFLIMDRRRSVVHRDHFDAVEAMLRDHNGDWTLVKAFPDPQDAAYSIALYRLTSGAQPMRKLPGWILPSLH